jgi:hypothetical protein
VHASGELTRRPCKQRAGWSLARSAGSLKEGTQAIQAARLKLQYTGYQHSPGNESIPGALHLQLLPPHTCLSSPAARHVDDLVAAATQQHERDSVALDQPHTGGMPLAAEVEHTQAIACK